MRNHVLLIVLTITVAVIVISVIRRRKRIRREVVVGFSDHIVRMHQGCDSYGNEYKASWIKETLDTIRRFNIKPGEIGLKDLNDFVELAMVSFRKRVAYLKARHGEDKHLAARYQEFCSQIESLRSSNPC